MLIHAPPHPTPSNVYKTLRPSKGRGPNTQYLLWVLLRSKRHSGSVVACCGHWWRIPPLKAEPAASARSESLESSRTELGAWRSWSRIQWILKRNSYHFYTFAHGFRFVSVTVSPRCFFLGASCSRRAANSSVKAWNRTIFQMQSILLTFQCNIVNISKKNDDIAEWCWMHLNDAECIWTMWNASDCTKITKT